MRTLGPIAATVGIVVSSPALAGTIHFDNSDLTFVFGRYTPPSEGWLDLTTDKHQSGATGPQRFNVYDFGYSSRHPFTTSIVGPSNLAGGGAPMVYYHYVRVGDVDVYSPDERRTPREFAPGDFIGAPEFATTASDLGASTLWPDGTRRDVNFADHAFVGARIQINGATHYGYIELMSTTPGGRVFDALSWGYESEPNTPVRIIPSPAAFLWLGSLAAASRRRR